jgi:UDP-glucose 4-epimerase
VEAPVRGPINIGTGVETNVLELVTILRELAGAANIEPQFAPARLGELPRSCLDISLARETLGWAPTIAIREGLRLTLEASRAAPAR